MTYHTVTSGKTISKQRLMSALSLSGVSLKL